MPYGDRERQLRYQLEWMHQRRRAYFDGRTCANCGGPAEELDHIDPATKVNHRIWSWAKDRREAELAKCQTLCKGCHKSKTKAQVVQIKHGTSTMYRKGCRCRPCQDRQATRAREWRRTFTKPL